MLSDDTFVDKSGVYIQNGLSMLKAEIFKYRTRSYTKQIVCFNACTEIEMSAYKNKVFMCKEHQRSVFIDDAQKSKYLYSKIKCCVCVETEMLICKTAVFPLRGEVFAG